MGILSDINGAVVLDDVRVFIKRFCAFPDQHALDAVTMWSAHCHMVEHFHTTPRLAVLSVEWGSGKTRVLEVLENLVPEPMMSLSASPATVFRTLAERQITLLFDEVDTVFRTKGRDDTNEDLRALLNAGYKRTATIPRCVGPRHEVQHFQVYCAAALAGIGELPDTVMSRSVIIKMKRRAPGEHVEPYRDRVHATQGKALGERLALWAERVGAAAGNAWPDLPDGIVDRPAEVWEPLLAVADAAGGHWPETARAACLHLCEVAKDRRVSLGVRLLTDLQIIFGDTEALHTETIIERLVNPDAHGLDPDAPWAELHGKPISVRGLASLLKPYGVNSQKVKVHGRALQGYRREHLWDAWRRYLPCTPAEVEPVEPSAPGLQKQGLNRGFEGSGRETDPEPVEPSQVVENIRRVPEVPEVPDSRSGESAPWWDGAA